MRRIALAGIAVGLGAAALAVPASAVTTTVFRVAVKDVSSHTNRSGNVVTLRDHLVRPRDHDVVVGHEKVRCHVLSGTRVRCRSVDFFPQGKVKTKGVINPRADRRRLSVIGGTRGYNGVAGKVIVNIRPRLSRLTFFLIK